MKKKVLFCGVLLIATVTGFAIGDIKDTQPVEANSYMTVSEYIETVEKKCEKYNISKSFVKNVIETDRVLGDKDISPALVEELANYFEKYEDTYAVLMCHHYGEEDAKILTCNFQYFMEDNVYFDTFSNIENEYIKREIENK